MAFAILLSLAMQVTPVPVPPAEAAVPPLTVADMSGDAMQHAVRLLGGYHGGFAVSGSIRNVAWPSRDFRVVYNLAARPLAPDLCETTQFSIIMSRQPGAAVAGSSAEHVVPGLRETASLFAVLSPDADAFVTGCVEEVSYIPLVHGETGARQIRAYRRLRQAMHSASSGRPLDFSINCQSEVPSDCSDARAALANLPMGVIWEIYSLGARQVRDPGGYYTRPPIAPGAAYIAHVNFGPSEQDGRSWRAEWRETGSGLDEIRLRRLTVFYH